MIDINKLTENDKGRKVIYSRKGFEGIELPFSDVRFGNKFEEGIITSWNDSFMFIRYGKDIHSKATYPSDLIFTTPNPSEVKCG